MLLNTIMIMKQHLVIC